MERTIEFNKDDKRKVLNLIKRVKTAITKRSYVTRALDYPVTPFVTESTLSWGIQEKLWMKGKDGRVYWGLCNTSQIFGFEKPHETFMGVTLGFADKSVNSHVILEKVLDCLLDREREQKSLEELGFSYTHCYSKPCLLFGKITEWEEFKEVTVCRFFDITSLESHVFIMFNFLNPSGETRTRTDSFMKYDVCPMEELRFAKEGKINWVDMPRVLLDKTREFVHKDFANLYALPKPLFNLLGSPIN